MDYASLVKGHCESCEGGTEPLKKEEIANYLSLLKTPWKVSEDKKIEKEYKFKDFKESMEFVNKIADIAEEQGHHPNIEIEYNRVEVELTTHAIKGLSVNDFVMASKIEAIE